MADKYTGRAPARCRQELPAIRPQNGMMPPKKAESRTLPLRLRMRHLHAFRAAGSPPKSGCIFRGLDRRTIHCRRASLRGAYQSAGSTGGTRSPLHASSLRHSGFYSVILINTAVPQNRLLFCGTAFYRPNSGTKRGDARPCRKNAKYTNRRTALIEKRIHPFVSGKAAPGAILQATDSLFRHCSACRHSNSSGPPPADFSITTFSHKYGQYLETTS